MLETMMGVKIILIIAFATLSAAIPNSYSTILCPITKDGRIPINMTLKAFDTTASPFDPNYSKGQNLSWSQILKFPHVKPSRFDAYLRKAVEVTIDDRSIFVPGGGTQQLG